MATSYALTNLIEAVEEFLQKYDADLKDYSDETHEALVDARGTLDDALLNAKREVE